MTHTLDRIPMFESLSGTDRDALARLLVPRRFGAGEQVFRQGDPGGEMFVVESGRVSVTARDENDREIELSVLGQGAFFGEISLLDGGRRTASVHALETVNLLALDRDAFFSFLERHPSAARHVVEVLAGRQREMVERVRGIRNVNEAVEAERSPAERLLDRIAAVAASGWFLLANLVVIMSWIAWNVASHPAPIRLHDDPPTFFIMALAIGLESILLTIFLLISQSRSRERDRIRDDLEYQLNVEAHREVLRLHQKLDRLQAAVDTGREAGDGSAGTP
jgi:uncharacterized membrane protein